jgi:hypothetical protein
MRHLLSLAVASSACRRHGNSSTDRECGGRQAEWQGLRSHLIKRGNMVPLSKTVDLRTLPGAGSINEPVEELPSSLICRIRPHLVVCTATTHTEAAASIVPTGFSMLARMQCMCELHYEVAQAAHP